MPSFDIVSEVDTHELTNAVDQANRELATRFDFKGVDAKFVLEDKLITQSAPSDFQLQQMTDILRARLIARKIDARCLDFGDIETNLAGARQKITVKQGEKEVLASVESEAASPERAESLAKALNALLVLNAVSRAGKDEEVIMRNTNAAPDGKKVVVNFSMPRQTVVEMIKKQMQPGV